MKRQALIVIGLVVGSILGAPLVMAQDDPRETLRDAREAKEQSRVDRAELARQIDVLAATDDQLIVALGALTEQVEAQQRDIAVATAAIEDAIIAEAAVRQKIADTQTKADELRAITQERLIAAYVAPREDTTDESDITRLARREALFRYVDLDGRDLLDQLRAVEDDLDRLFLEASLHRRDTISFQADLETALRQLSTDVARQVAIRAELADVVSELDAEIAAMAAAEGEINAIIRDAQREIAREEALARAATSTTTTTTTPPTTTAPGEPDDEGSQPGDADSESGSTEPSGSTTSTVAPDASADLANLGLIWPTTGSITSSFGTRVHPITGTERHHSGLDIGNSKGTSIWSAQGGTVIFSGRMSGYGETVIVSHGPGLSTLYAHMSARSVTKGSSLSQGQEVGKMGSTGFSTGDHLHFELRVEGTAVNPRIHLP